MREINQRKEERVAKEAEFKALDKNLRMKRKTAKKGKSSKATMSLETAPTPPVELDEPLDEEG